MKDAFLKSADLVLKELNSDGKHGMSLAQVEESREKYGKNSFTQQARESMTKRIWDASTEPMLLMLIFAAIITLAREYYPIFYRRGIQLPGMCRYFCGNQSLSVVITIMTEGKSAKAFEALNQYQ